MGKLNLDPARIRQARKAAAAIADQVYEFVATRSTVAVERTVLRLLGLDGVDARGVPLPNVVVDHLKEAGKLESGAALPFVNAVSHTGLTPEEVALAVSRGELSLPSLPFDRHHAFRLARRLAEDSLMSIVARRKEREQWLARWGDRKDDTPLLYVIVATGNIHEDVVQAQAAARQGADIIAVIRSTGQSLLDYVPFGTTSEGYGGTYATQENFRIMRRALDATSEQVGRYIRLCNYCSGLCMPEIAAMGALERLDVMLNDALYGILFRDINMQRTMIDQAFSRQINAFAGIIINTGEDNYLTTADAVEAAHTVLASQFINEQMALRSGLPPEQIGLGHAFEIDPEIENGFLLELAQAQMAREIFPRAPLKYMPPTKHMTGNIFRGHIQDAMFNLAGVITGQRIQLLGMMTEAIHTPLLHDRFLSIENARYVFRNARSLGEEILFVPDGIIQTRAAEVLRQAVVLLEKIAESGLFLAQRRGVCRCAPPGGRGTGSGRRFFEGAGILQSVRGPFQGGVTRWNCRCVRSFLTATAGETEWSN
jgi:beta-lysine 5,6-aminomutase alpha subunit